MKKLTMLICGVALVTLGLTPVYAGEKSGEKKEGAKAMEGCLADGASDGWYVLTKKKDDGTTKDVKVQGDDSFEAHIGHQVELTGEWKGEGDEKYFHATGMKHLAASCS